MKGTSVNAVIGALILAVVGLALFPIAVQFTNTAQTGANVTATQSTLLGLVPTFYVIGLVVAVIALLIGKRFFHG